MEELINLKINNMPVTVKKGTLPTTGRIDTQCSGRCTNPSTP